MITIKAVPYLRRQVTSGPGSIPAQFIWNYERKMTGGKRRRNYRIFRSVGVLYTKHRPNGMMITDETSRFKILLLKCSELLKILSRKHIKPQIRTIIKPGKMVKM
jgi:hypothetical protein